MAFIRSEASLACRTGNRFRSSFGREPGDTPWNPVNPGKARCKRIVTEGNGGQHSMQKCALNRVPKRSAIRILIALQLHKRLCLVLSLVLNKNQKE